MQKILIADDHHVVRRGIRKLLESRPHLQIVAEASDGRIALEQVQTTRPDIAIIDYSLPALNGLDLTTALKRASPKLEVLIYTMHASEDLMLGVLRAGARGYVLKSDTEKHLLAAVDALSIHRPYFSSMISETLLERFLESAPHVPAPLTHREREVVQLVAEGKLNKEVAYTLSISSKTVETHRASAMSKLELRTTAELVRFAVRNNIIQP